MHTLLLYMLLHETRRTTSSVYLEQLVMENQSMSNTRTLMTAVRLKHLRTARHLHKESESICFVTINYLLPCNIALWLLKYAHDISWLLRSTCKHDTSHGLQIAMQRTPVPPLVAHCPQIPNRTRYDVCHWR